MKREAKSNEKVNKFINKRKAASLLNSKIRKLIHLCEAKKSVFFNSPSIFNL